MQYAKPTLDVIGRALQVVLGGMVQDGPDRVNGTPILTRTSDGTLLPDGNLW